MTAGIEAASVQHKSLSPALPVWGSEDLILSLTFHSNIIKVELTKKHSLSAANQAIQPQSFLLRRH